MSVINLKYLFDPKSIAVVGATNEADDPGSIVTRNLMGGGFSGPVMPVSSQAEAISGVLTYPDVGALPKAPDLAIIANPLAEVPDILTELKAKGVRAAVLVGSGFTRMAPGEREEFRRTVRSIISVPDMRVLGPKSLGFMVPSSKLFATLAHSRAVSGKLAFISQSDSLFATVVDWARNKGLGFSHLIALGARLDVTFADIIDYLGTDPMTRAIMIYVESIHDAREFMSAARAASRNKPVLVLRPGTALEALPACSLDEGPCVPGLTGEIYEVAFRRAGMLRVDTIDELFDAARTVSSSRNVKGRRLAILTNGASAGVMAADRLLAGGGKLAEFSVETNKALETLPGGRGADINPVCIPYDADGEVYATAVKTLVRDKGVDAVLVMHVPWAAQSEVGVAEAVAKTLKRVKKLVLTAWLGSGSADDARAVFAREAIPTYESLSQAVRAFLHMADYRLSQDLLMETPDSLPTDFFPDTLTARKIVERAFEEGRSYLSEPEAKGLLAAYGIPVVETRVAVSAKDAVIAADELGYPVAVKVRSPQIAQPFNVGGVLLDLETPERVWEGAATLLARVNRERPDAYIDGFTVQKMGRRPGAHELFISAETDPVFGPVLRFGHGGMTREVVQDSALALPPLSMTLAREAVKRTRISHLLTGTPTQPPADTEDVCLTLIQISQLLIDIPQVNRLDINPLYADNEGVLALGAKIELAAFSGDGQERLAIRPYPRELEECVFTKAGRKITLRPIRPEDEATHRAFLANLSDEDLRMRFFGVVRRDFDHKDLARFTQIDYDREMAFIATAIDEDGNPETLGVMRTNTRPDNSEAEFAIVVRSDMKGHGLGSLLFHKGIEYTRMRGTRILTGQTMAENKAMQGLSRKFGFVISPDPNDPDVVDMTLDLTGDQ